MTNTARGEAEIEIAGRRYTVTINMGALASLAAALGVETFDDLRAAVFKLPNMPKVVSAILEANGHQVSEADIAAMDWPQYLDRLLPALFRTERDKPAAEGGEANPPKARAKR